MMVTEEYVFFLQTYQSSSGPCISHLHAQCVCRVLQQRSFAAQLHVEVGGVRCEAEILSEVNTLGRTLCQTDLMVTGSELYL